MNVARTFRVASPLVAAARPKLDLNGAVGRFREVGLPRFYSLGAGKKFFYGAAVVSYFMNILSIGVGAILYGIAKTIGLAKERTAVNNVASLITSDQDKQLLRQSIKDNALPTTLEARLTEKLNKKGIVI